MKPANSFCIAALVALSLLITTSYSQNISITLDPINPPIQIPAPGGSFNYTIAVSNTGTSPLTFSVWIMIRLPNQSWYGPVVGPVSLTLPGGASASRQRSQAIPANAREGNYVYEGRVGIYPNTIWNADSFAFAKTMEGSQLWVARHDGAAEGLDYPYPHSLAADSAGNVYVTAVSWESGDQPDFITIKYNQEGQQLWIADYNGPGNSLDEPCALVLDREGNVYVTGRSVGTHSTDFCTIKYSTDGRQIWCARYCYPGAIYNWSKALTLDSEGNVLVTGFMSWWPSIEDDILTVKYNNNGGLLWAALYAGPALGISSGQDVTVDADSNVYVTGESQGFGSNVADFLTLKYDSDGNQIWEARYDGPGHEYDGAKSIVADAFRNVYVTGRSFTGPQYDQYSYTILKYDGNGNLLWERGFKCYLSGEEVEPGPALALDAAGNVYASGLSYDSTRLANLTLFKYNSAGDTLWSVVYRGEVDTAGFYHATSLAVDAERNVYLAGGITDRINDPLDYLTLKYNSNGNLVWSARYNGPENISDYATALTLDPAANVYVTGCSDNTNDDCGITTVKYAGGGIPNWQQPEALLFGSPEPVTAYALHPNHPNPFNASTVVSFELRVSSLVSLRVYDTAGKLVATLVDGWREVGHHEVTFDAASLPSGIYFARLLAGDFTAVQKMVLLK